MVLPEYVVREAADHQRADVEAIKRCVQSLRSAGEASPLAEEALGMARGHLESLEEIAG